MKSWCADIGTGGAAWSGHSGRLAAALSLAAAALVLGGCAAAEIQPAAPAAPVAPLPAGLAATEELWRDCVEEAPARAPARDIVVIYANTGRDFFDTEELDGYVVRVLPLDEQARPVKTPATMTFALYRERPAGGGLEPTPIRVWRIAAAEAPAYWLETQILGGYFVRLAWRRDPGMGKYRLGVKWRYEGRDQGFALCRYLDFEDYASRAADAGLPADGAATETNPSEE